MLPDEFLDLPLVLGIGCFVTDGDIAAEVDKCPVAVPGDGFHDELPFPGIFPCIRFPGIGNPGGEDDAVSDLAFPEGLCHHAATGNDTVMHCAIH